MAFGEKVKVLAGKYELQRRIGEGGCSVVYLAWDLHIGRHVALKALKEQNPDETEDILKKEMEMMKDLNHPMIPTVYDFFREDRWYLVMEYIDGESLHNIIKREGRLTQKQACEWAIQLLGLLSYLHGNQPPVIYRDLKPANIIVRADGRLKAVDFGAAFYVRYDCGNMLREKMAGTVGYASPEQLQVKGAGQIADERSDIYTFGAVLYHMLTGNVPSGQLHGGLSVRSINPSLSKDIERVVRKCTMPDPLMRYQSAGDIKKDLERIKYCNERKNSAVLFRMEKKIRLTEKKTAGLFGIGMLLACLTAGGFAIQAKGQEAYLPVTVYNKQGQKLLIRYDSIYEADDSFVFELEQKLFEGKGIHTLSISLTDSESGDRRERIFYIKGKEGK